MQQLVNRIWVSMVEAQTILAKQAFDSAAKLEETGCKEDFKKAQQTKILANELESKNSKMKSDYPHLFKEG